MNFEAFNQELGRRVNAARLKLGMSEHQLGDAINRTEFVVKGLENGNRIVSAWEIALISKALNVSPSHLLGEEDGEHDGPDTHTLKTVNPHFLYVWMGVKTFEFRCADRDYKVGDTLLLREYDVGTNAFSSAWAEVVVTHMLEDFEEFGFGPETCEMEHVIMSVKLLAIGGQPWNLSESQANQRIKEFHGDSHDARH